MVQTNRIAPPPLAMHRVASTSAALQSSLPFQQPKPAPVDFLARLEELEKVAEPPALWGGGAPATAPAAEPPPKPVTAAMRKPRTSMDDEDVMSSLKALEQQIDRARQRTVLAVRNSTSPE